MVPDDSWNKFCMLRRNFSMREESMLTRCGKFSRRQRTDLLGTMSRFITINITRHSGTSM